MQKNEWFQKAAWLVVCATLTVSSMLFSQKIRIDYQRGFIKSEFIIPPEERPTPQCHASTIVETGDGLLAAWYGGTEEGNADVCIWSARLDVADWSQPVQIADGIESDSLRYPCWNPVLFQPKEGALMLFYKVGPTPSEWWGMLKTSTDNGSTWSPPVHLPKGIYGPIKNKPIEIADGALLCGSSSEKDGWKVFFQITHDLGKTWRTIGPIQKPKSFEVIQPTLLTYKNGRICSLCRSQQGVIIETWSKDGGLTWSYMERSKLPNPNSGIDAVSLQDKRQLLVYNDSKTERTPLVVALGNKKGTTWKRVLRLEETEGEYSYPAVIQTADGMVHVTYTWNRETIKHVIIDPFKL
jgi:predicted neuraminidase